MPVSEESITLREATADDQKFLLRLFAATRDDLALAILAEEQKQVLIELQFRARENQYRLAYPNATTRIVVYGDQEIGSLLVDRGEDDFHLVDIVLLPDWRTQGIGTRLLRSLLDEASSATKPVCLQVAVTNRAIKLYERLGFARVNDGGAYISMKWSPRSMSDAASAGQETAGQGGQERATATI